MKKEKSNIDHLRAILDELGNHEFGTDPFNEKITEGKEFLDSIEDEVKEMESDFRDDLGNKNEEIAELNSTIRSLEENPETEEYNVGLDTLYIGMKNRNLKIEQQVEAFIESLRRENSVIPA